MHQIQINTKKQYIKIIICNFKIYKNNNKNLIYNNTDFIFTNISNIIFFKK